MAKEWAIIKYASFVPSSWDKQSFNIVVHKPSFGADLKGYEVIADDLTEEEAQALKTLLGE